MDCEHQYYSIILKACSRREKLGRRLETVLLRGRLAIKKAGDAVSGFLVFNYFFSAITTLRYGSSPSL
ncbi:hypothetical protein SCACP_41460 [Sporomusa carbonis]